MVCFCKSTAQAMTAMTPTANLSVMAVPPQMIKLHQLLGLQASASASLNARADMKLAAMLPKTDGDTWLKATLAATAPNIRLPAVLPAGPGPMLSMAMQLGAAAPSFPMTDPKALMAAVQQAVQSLAAHVLPMAGTAARIPAPQLQNMALAAKMTLALRAKGVCPMALANVNVSMAAQAGVTDSRGTCGAALAFAATLPRITVPPFALPFPQVAMALKMAALAPLATAPAAMGLPPASDPNLAGMLMNQLAALSTVPVPPLPAPPEELAALADKLEDLAAIQEAFGPDALTPAGVARVNAMLSYVAQLKVPIPLPALAVQAQLDALPNLDDIMQGAQAAQSGAANLAVSMTAAPPPVPIQPVIEALQKLADQFAGMMGPCEACSVPIGPIQQGLAGVQLPPPPAIPSMPS